MLSDVYTIWLREMKRFLRARSRVISSIAMPFFWLIFIGVGFGSSVSLPNTNYLSFLVPGVIGMTILFTSIFSGLSVIYERQFGFLKEILVAPISRTSIVLGKTVGSASVALFNGLIMLGIATSIGAIPISSGMLLAVVFMFLIAVSFVSVGLLIASRMRSTEGFQAIMSFFVMPTFFLSGALFPIEKTPLWMQTVSHIDPLSYGVDGIRGALIGANVLPLWMDLVVLVSFGLVFIMSGSYLFRKSVQ